MFCPKCGQWNAGSATQCTACGTSLLPPGFGDPPPSTTPAPTVPAGPPSYPQTVYPGYPQQQQPYPNAPGAPSGYPPASPVPSPSYSAMPGTAPPPMGSPYGASPQSAYGAGYPTPMQQALSQCKVCGSMIGYGGLACSVCNVPLHMIANPFDPTVTTYLDARALNQPGTSPVYAAPGAYAGRPAHAENAVPEEARQGWNWPAALNSTLWAFTHRSAGWGLLCAGGLFFWVMIILVLSSMSPSDLHSTDPADAAITTGIMIGAAALFWLIKTLYLGSKGNAIAWRSGRYTNLSQMKNVQKQWKGWSFLVFSIASVVLITATVISGKR